MPPIFCETIVATSKVDHRIPSPISILGTRVHPFADFEDVLHCIAGRVADRRKTFCVAINPEKVYAAAREPAVRSALESSELGICDGIGVTLGAWLLYRRVVKRHTDNLWCSLVELAATKGWRVFFLGASPESNAKTCAYFLDKYPDLQVSGARDGYFDDSEEVIQQINEGRTDLLFVAMGTPKQEMWIAAHRDRLTAIFCMGVGGAFDVVSGKVRRAPRFFRIAGLEFLYRLVTQPTRFRRQLALPKYGLMILKERCATYADKYLAR